MNTTMKTRLSALFLVFAMIIACCLIPVGAADTTYSTWKQSDPLWASKTLGNNGTMKSWGCLITSIAILEAKAGVRDSDFNPGVLRDELENNGFISHSSTVAADGNLNYGSAFSKENSPQFYYVSNHNYHPTPFSQIVSDVSDLLNDGYFVAVNVNYGGHWVAADSSDGSDIKICDPGYNRTSLKDYDGGIEQCIYFKANSVASSSASAPIVPTLTGATIPSDIKYGNVFILRGTIKGSHLCEATVAVYDSTGAKKTGCSKTFNNVSCIDIKKDFDVYVEFNKLDRGTYYYVVSVNDGTKTHMLLSRRFNVR